MAKLKITGQDAAKAVETASRILDSMQRVSTDLEAALDEGRSIHPKKATVSSYTEAMQRLAEGLNAVSGLLQTYEAVWPGAGPLRSSSQQQPQGGLCARPSWPPAQASSARPPVP